MPGEKKTSISAQTGTEVHDPKGISENFGQKNFGLNFRSLLKA